MKQALLMGWMLLLSTKICGQDTVFVSQPIPDTVFSRMLNKSFPDGCSVQRSELRYLTLSYCDKDGKTQRGELVVNKAIANDVVAIFRELWKAKYPIEQMRLVDDFGADDQKSMAANNTSSFCFRRVANSNRLSCHAFGMAIDLNPLYNPYVRSVNGQLTVEPKAGRKYAVNRNQWRGKKFVIDTNDLAYKLFVAHGFKWGGAWKSCKDYQHFEK
ncbi:MAG: M15 family metallopeptidase [Bacteroidaceae bacterium]|nr:M15 family metallopeptidase [Bacteroidaceae bacterium]